MPWLWRKTSDCRFATLQMLMASDLDEGWKTFCPDAEVSIAKMHQFGECEGIPLSLEGRRKYTFQLHHQMEDGMLLEQEQVVAGRPPDVDYYVLCRWTGPKSILTIEREHIKESQYIVRAYTFGGATRFEAKMDCAKFNWFALAHEAYAQDESIKNLMFVEGGAAVGRIWWPQGLAQARPSAGELGVPADQWEERLHQELLCKWWSLVGHAAGCRFASSTSTSGPQPVETTEGRAATSASASAGSTKKRPVVRSNAAVTKRPAARGV